MVLEIDNLALNALLLAVGYVGIHFHFVDQDAVLQVGRLVDVALVGTEGEEIVGGHGRGIIDVAAHEHELAKVGGNVVVFHPEHGVLAVGTAKVVASLQDGADGRHLFVEGGCVLVVVFALLDEIDLHLVGRKVGIVDARLAFGIRFVENLIAVHQVLHLDLVFCREILVAVQLVVVRLDLSAVDGVEEEGEEVHAVALRHGGIIEYGVGILGEI